MMLRNTVLFSLASVALAVEPKFLRTTSVQQQTQEEPPSDPATVEMPLLMEPNLAAVQQAKEAEEDSLDVGIGTFGMKKGIKCDGGFEAKKGMKKHCEGGIEKDFSMSWTTSDLKSELSEELMKQLEDFMPSSDMLIGVSDEEMEAHLLFDDEEDDAPLTKTMEFGGTMKAEWGCKVTYTKSVKGFSKKVECGAKYDAGSGKKEIAADGSSVLDYFNEAGGSMATL